MSAVVQASSNALSTLVSASRELVISIEAGSPVELDLNQAFAGGAASYSDRGTAVVLNLEAYTESLPASEQGSGGVALVKAACTRSGNQALLPLARQTANSDNFENSSRGKATAGSHSITASISRSPERIVFAYDPVSLAASTTRFGVAGANLVYFYSADVASWAALSSGGAGGVLDAALSTLISSSRDVILLRVGNSLAIGALKSSNVAVNTIARGFLNAPDDVIILSTADPRVGFGFDATPGQPTYGHTAGRLTLTADVPVESALSPAWSPVSVQYVFYRVVSNLAAATWLSDAFKVFFGQTVSGVTAVPSGSSLVSTHRLASAAVSTSTRPSVSLVFNAYVITSRDGVAADGGIYRG